MCDLISREEAILAFYNATGDGDKAEWCRWVLSGIPSAEKTGKWIKVGEIEGIYDIEGVRTRGIKYQCPHCGFIHTVIEDFGIYSYCPNCGNYNGGEE